MDDLTKYIRDIPDFPKPGIIFKDITPLLKSHTAFSKVIDAMYDKYKGEGVDYVVGIESRGFIIGPTLASRLGVGFVPIRKKGKLPYKTISQSYELEYGTDSIEMHEDALSKGDKVLLVDDLIATGGTLSASEKMIKSVGAQLIGIAVIVELAFLNGRDKLSDDSLFSIISY